MIALLLGIYIGMLIQHREWAVLVIIPIFVLSSWDALEPKVRNQIRSRLRLRNKREREHE